MEGSWKGFRQSVKSRWSALAGGLWRSRERMAEKARRLQQRVEEQRKQIRDLQSEWERERQSQQAVLDELREQQRQWEQDRRVLEGIARRLPDDPPLGTHGYGARMISLCVNVAQKVGLRASQLPPPGTPLTHADVRVLTVQPGTSWKCADMERAYEEVAQRCGVPRAVLVDGAPELRDGAEVLKSQRADTIVLGDFKHKAANVLKSVVGGDERFSEFQTQVGQTRSAIQQTELAHLVPPGKRPKARFMNLASTLHWAAMVLWLLNHPEAKGRAAITPERLQDKLGWLREYAADACKQSACPCDLVTAWQNRGSSSGSSDGAEAKVSKPRGRPKKVTAS